MHSKYASYNVRRGSLASRSKKVRAYAHMHATTAHIVGAIRIYTEQSAHYCALCICSNRDVFLVLPRREILYLSTEFLRPNKKLYYRAVLGWKSSQITASISRSNECNRNRDERDANKHGDDGCV